MDSVILVSGDISEQKPSYHLVNLEMTNALRQRSNLKVQVVGL